MRTVWRFIFVGFLTIVTSVIVNRFHPQGIRLHELALIFPTSYSTEIQTVSVDSALIFMFEETAIFLDIRPPDQYAIDHIPTAISLPFKGVSPSKSDRLKNIETKPWILYDFQTNSKQAKYLFKRLKKKNAGRVYLLEGGFAEWLEKRYPLELGENMIAPALE